MNILFSKEFIFAILLLSGTLKAIMPLLSISGIPDLTLISAGVVIIIMLNHMRTTLYNLSYKKFELLGLLSIFYMFMIFSLGYTSANTAAITKTINFGTMILAFYFPLLVKDFDVKKFMLGMSILIFFSSIIFLNFYTSYLARDEAMISSMGEDVARQMTALYLTVSWLNGFLVLYYFFQKKQVTWLKWSILLIAFTLLISAGGRGPLIFTMFILGFYFLYQVILSLNSFRLNKLMIPILIVISATISIIIIISNTDVAKENKSLRLVNNTVERLIGLTKEKGGGASAYSRIENAIFSIEKINKSPFWGYGIGSYAYEKEHEDILDYPHNLLLEIWFELGYIPLLLFLFLFFRIYKNINPKQCPWCLALYFYFLLNVLKSSSLIDIRTMLGFYAIFMTIEFTEKQMKNNITNKHQKKENVS